MVSDLNSQQILQDLSNNLPAAIFIYTLNKDGTDSVQYISDGCFSIWGVAAEDVTDNASLLWEVVHPDDIENMRSCIQVSAKELSKWECEWRITPYGSNQIKWLKGYGTPHENSDGSIIWNSVILNITKEKQSQLSERQALKHTISVLVSALEARDPYTAGHGKNVGHIASEIGHELGMSDEHIEVLYLGGLIHDVGKISTPVEILTKPTKLLKEEYSLIQLHPSTGGTFFEQVELNWPIKEMIEQHHERLDGSGYPKGLKGDEINFDARVVAVADVIDSMSTNRPYRFAPGINAAIKFLQEGKGNKFDERVVNAVLRLIKSNKLKLNE